MKSFIPYSLLLATAACGVAYGVTTTAFTVPVGYVTLTTPATSDATITPPVEKAPLFAGASTSISGNNVGASGITASAFTTPECYLQVTSGTLIGRRFPITANSSSTITVQVPVTSPVTTLQDLGFVSTNTFKVVPYWTLSTLFPLGAGVGTNADALNPTSFVFASDATGTGVNRASANLYFYCSGDVDNGIPAGWYDSGDVFGSTTDNLRIDFARLYSIRSSSATPLAAVVSGQVPDVPPVISVAVTTGDNDNYLVSPFPIDISLQEAGLQSAIQASPDALNPIESIFVFDDSASGYNKAASKAYFYCSGDVDNGIPAGWYDTGDVFGASLTTSNKVIKVGRGLIIRKAAYGSAGSILWSTAALPYSLTL